MAYLPSDPRSQLISPSEKTVTANFPARFLDFTVLAPDEISDRGSRTWWVRGQNFALAYTLARKGETFVRTDQPDEYVVLLPHDAAAATISVRDAETRVRGASMVVVPAGASRIAADVDTHIVRLFSSASPDLLVRCRNDAAYAQPHPNVEPFAPWPDPTDGPTCGYTR